jgi:hypothetical protein
MQIHQRKESIGHQDEENAKSIPVFKRGKKGTSFHGDQ